MSQPQSRWDPMGELHSLRSELSSGSQRRAFDYRVSLPSNVDGDSIEATMDHGLLTVRLPRSNRPPRRTITVGRARPAGGTGPAAGEPTAG